MVSYFNQQNEQCNQSNIKKKFKKKKLSSGNSRNICESKGRLVNGANLNNVHLLNDMIKKDYSIKDAEEESESIDSGCVVENFANISNSIDWDAENAVIKNEYHFIKSLLQHMPWYDSKRVRVEHGESISECVPLYKTPEVIERQMKLAAADRKEKRQQKSDSKKEYREKKEANKKSIQGPGNIEGESIKEDDGIETVCNDDEIDNEKSMPLSQLNRSLPLHERRVRLEAQLEQLKANKGSLPAYKWVKLIPKLHKKLAIVIKKEGKEKIKVKNSSKAPNNVSCSNKQQASLIKDSKKERKSKPSKIYNQGGDLVFNKFDFTSAGDVVSHSDKKPKNLHKIMSTIIKEKQKIDNLSKNSKLEKASERMEGGLWDNALKRASGEKVKDDPNRIKKTIKNKANKKKSSAVRWNEHDKMISKLAKDRETRKKHNIQKRKESNNKFKGKEKAKSKGKSHRKKGAPGF